MIEQQQQDPGQAVAEHLAGMGQLHLTLTGASAGTSLCLRRVVTLGEGMTDRTEPGDQFAHWAYTSDAEIDKPTTCEDCRHAARCAWLDGDDCARCEAMGWQPDPPAAGYVDVENISPIGGAL